MQTRRWLLLRYDKAVRLEMRHAQAIPSTRELIFGTTQSKRQLSYVLKPDDISFYCLDPPWLSTKYKL